jgi:hypothetical protein
MNDPQFASYDVPPEKAQAARKHGCFYYGCITAVVLMVLLMLLAYLGYRYVMYQYNEWTSPAPEIFAKVEMSPEDREALHKRFNDFNEALEAQKPVEPLTLNSDELNVLLEDNPDVKDHVHVDIKGDKIDGRVSLPLGGRFLNGSAELKVSLENGVLIVLADSISVKGRPLPDSVMQGFRSQNLAQDAYKNPKNAEFLRKIDSVEVKDGTITVKARPKAEASAEPKTVERETPPDQSAPAQKKDETPQSPGRPDEGKSDSPAPPKSPN